MRLTELNVGLSERIGPDEITVPNPTTEDGDSMKRRWGD
jgi:hypothetical protein